MRITMKTLELHQMEQIKGGDKGDKASFALGAACFYAVGITAVAGALSGGIGFWVGAAIWGPTCIGGAAAAAAL